MTLSPGALARISLTAFCTDGPVRQDGITYECRPRSQFQALLALGWLPLGPCGVRDGITVDLFAWLCDCKIGAPA